MLRNAIVNSSLKSIKNVFNGADIHNKLLKKKKMMMHPCRNIFKRPFLQLNYLRNVT